MKKSFPFISKASSFILLAFSFGITVQAQEIKSLSGANSPNDDTNPVWIGNNTLLFTRAFHPGNLGGTTDPGDIWMTQKGENGEWSQATHRPDLSSPGYDLPLGLEDVLTLLVLRKDGGAVSVHQYSKFGNDWNYLRKVNFSLPELVEGSVTGRVIEGGKGMLISAKLSNGNGNEDIYISEKTGPIDWAPVQNLGKTVNGFGQEVGPYFNPKTLELFYSSNSHPGATGKDILISKKLGDTWQDWSIPVRWDQISSAGSDASITLIDESLVVWTSTLNSDGFADLMTFAVPVPLVLPEKFEAPVAPMAEEKKATPTPIRQIPKPVEIPSPLDTAKAAPVNPVSTIPVDSVQVSRPIEEVKEVELPISFQVIDVKSKQPLTYDISWQSGNAVMEVVEPFLVSQLTYKGITSVKLSAPGYFPKQIPLSLLDSKQSNLVQLTKAEAGSVVLLENVNFKRGTSELENDETQLVLKDLALFLQENSNLRIRINGHTDNVGDPGLNKQLSLERAGSIRDFLVNQGVNFESIRISGWGGTKPIASNVTESGRAKNRRVELVVEN